MSPSIELRMVRGKKCELEKAFSPIIKLHHRIVIYLMSCCTMDVFFLPLLIYSTTTEAHKKWREKAHQTHTHTRVKEQKVYFGASREKRESAT